MTKVTAFLGRKLADASFRSLKTKAATVVGGAPALDGADVPFTSDMGTKLGQEHETLRGMLDETARRIGSLDLIKEAYDKLSEPIVKAIQALERERVQNTALQTLLNGLTETHDKQRAELQAVKKRSASLDDENAALRGELERLQEHAGSLEAERLQLANDLVGKRDRVAFLERQVAHESAERRRLADDYSELTQQFAEVERRIVHAETEAVTAGEKSALAESELKALRQSLDETMAESARRSRRLVETGTQLGAANAEIAKLATAVSAATAERDRLANALDDANGRRQADQYALNVRFDALQARALSAEKLLSEARQALAARTEEVRRFDRSQVETTMALNSANKRVEDLEAALAKLDSSLRESDQARHALAERSDGLARNLRERETALMRAQDRIHALTERLAKLEADTEANAAAQDKRMEDLSVALQRERMERSMLEGALETARRDYAALHHEHSVLKAAAEPEVQKAVG